MGPMAASPSIWDDWLKFVPGWLAFLVTSGTGLRKAWTRRFHLALGPEAESLRELLISVRTLLEENRAFSHRLDWFFESERANLGRVLRDSAARRSDPALRLAITRVADSWDELYDLAPAMDGTVRRRRNPDRWEEAPKTPEEFSDRFQEMVDVAETGLIDIQTALDRLNELERRTTGRT